MMKKISIILLLNCFVMVIIFFGIYGYFEKANSVMSAKHHVENQLKSLAYFGLHFQNNDIKEVHETITTWSDWPVFFKIKSIKRGDYEYFIYQSEERKGYIFFVIYKTYQSKVENFFAVLIDSNDKRIILPSMTEFDRDTIDVLLPLLNEYLKVK